MNFRGRGLRTESGGSHTYETTKNFGEMRLIREPRSHTDIEQGHTWRMQKLSGAFYSLLDHIPMRAESGALLKESSEVVEIHRRHVRKD